MQTLLCSNVNTSSALVDNSSISPLIINMDEHIAIEKKCGFIVDKNVFMNTVLCSIVLNVLSIYCSIIYIITI